MDQNQNNINKFVSDINIIDVVSNYVDLEQKGNNYFAPCPFHSEDTPSFSVSSDKQIYKCFGCGEGGNVISFVSKIENLNFRKTIEKLAKDFSLDLKNYNLNFRKLDPKLEKIYEINEYVNKYFKNNLLNTKKGMNALKYLTKDRNLTSDIIDKFEIGYAINETQSLSNILNKKYLENEINLTKLTTKNNYDFFIDRIIFPIRNVNQDIIGFSGRTMSKDKTISKYINLPSSQAFDKSKVLYNINNSIDEIRKKDEVIIFEGYMDLISAYQAGVKNTVAIMGTSFTKEQINLLSKITNNFTIAFDSDKAGKAAIIKNIDVLLDYPNIKLNIINFPDDTDPDEFILKKGNIEFQKVVKNKISSIIYKIDHIIKDYDLENPYDHAKLITIIENDLKKLTSYKEKILFKDQIQKKYPQIKLTINSFTKEEHTNYNKVTVNKVNDPYLIQQRWDNIIKSSKIKINFSVSRMFLKNDLEIIKILLDDPNFINKLYDNKIKVDGSQITKELFLEFEYEYKNNNFNKNIFILNYSNKKKAFEKLFKQIENFKVNKDYVIKKSLEINKIKDIIENINNYNQDLKMYDYNNEKGFKQILIIKDKIKNEINKIIKINQKGI